MSDLDTLARLHGTDKSSLQHGYTAQYKRYFVDLPKKGRLLELGWGGHEDPEKGGESAGMWADWLPDWDIHIVDNEAKSLENMARVARRNLTLHTWDQADPLLGPYLEKNYGPLDIIIDDASHLSSLTIKSFENLWPHLNPGGWYVVEDTHMAYHDFYYGSSEASPNPSNGVDGYGDDESPSTRVTAMGWLKRMADQANFKGRGGWDLFPPEYDLGFDVEEVHFHFNICFVRKRG